MAGGELYWYTSGGEILDETDLSGNLSSEYIFFGGARIARRDASGNVFYYLADHLDSSRVMAEIPAGQTTATMCYDADFYPFGGERAYTNSCQQNYKFTGKERDPESGLDNFVARYYGSSIGRFMSADDPFVGWQLNDPQSLNLYAYVQDNPINDVDPTGHMGALAGQCFTSAPQKQVASGCPGGPSVFDTLLDCTLDPACGQFWGTSAISGAEFGDPLSVGRANDLQAAENQHANNVSETVGLTKIEHQLQKDKIPDPVIQAILTSVMASNSPSEEAGDPHGGFHEEGGEWGKDASGNIVVIPAKPGPYADPTKSPYAWIDVAQAENPDLARALRSFEGTWHVHPSGVGFDDNLNLHYFQQSPDKQDRTGKGTRWQTNIVVGAGDNKVYEYDQNGKTIHP